MAVRETDRELMCDITPGGVASGQPLTFDLRTSTPLYCVCVCVFSCRHRSCKRLQDSSDLLESCLSAAPIEVEQSHWAHLSPPHPPTHTIILFISQHLRALLAFAAICAELNWVIFPSRFNISYYPVASLSCIMSTFPFAYSLSASTGR